MQAPPVQASVVSTVHLPAPLASSSSMSLPSDSELLQQASFSTINVAAATPAAATINPAATKPATPAPAAPTATVSISSINYDGKVPTTEADEYVVITNGSKGSVDLAGYYVYVATTGTQGPTFTFPKDSTIKPGQSVRIYTNEIHKETGGYTFQSGKAIWNNRGGLAVLKDGKGKKIAEFKYAPSA